MDIANSQMLMMAPLAGFTDRAFREIVSEFGSRINTTEMVSLKGIYYNDQKTKDLLAVSEKESPCILQIFGHDPSILEVVMPKINAMDQFIGIDLNMGCPAPKIVNNGDGSYMMTQPLKTYHFLKKLVQRSNKPISVKFRLGFDENHINYLEIGKICEDAGVHHVCLHPRTRTQFYRGKADWSKIAQLKNHLSIPVIGNGDLFTSEDIDQMFYHTKCDAVSLGRGALHNPFLFQKNSNYTYDDIHEVIKKHYKLKIKYVGYERGIKEMRKAVAYYLKGLPKSASVKNDLNHEVEIDRIYNILEDFFNEIRGDL
ncbi:MAG: tRNA-dihydrouridine synthase [Tissierellia bacterium]|nr:tRNA-dihydrouridine synthase [Tissierellia bacterium]